MLMFSACKKSDYYISEEEAAEFDKIANPTVNNIVFIDTNDIYYYNTPNKKPLRLTYSPTEPKYYPRLSPDKSKIAYINKDGHPAIINALTGDSIRTYTNFSGIKSYDWVPYPSKARAAGLYMLIGDKVEFSEISPDNPPIPDIDLGPGGEWHQVAYDEKGNFFFFVTEVRSTGPQYKLYRWDRATGKRNILETDVKIIRPDQTALFISGDGDAQLLTSFGGTGKYDTYYIWKPGKLIYDIKGTNQNMIEVRYNSSTGQALIFGNNPLKLYSEMTVKNYAGFPRSKDSYIDTAYIKSMTTFDWK